MADQPTPPDEPIVLRMGEPGPAEPYEAGLIPERVEPASYIPQVTPGLLAALERRYLPAELQRCVVCGAPMAFSSSGDRNSPGARYNCSVASPIGSTLPLRERLEHWDRSTWYDRSIADIGVVTLVRAYRELEPRAACPCFDSSVEERLREDAAAFQSGAESLDVAGFVTRTLDAIGAATDTEDAGKDPAGE